MQTNSVFGPHANTHTGHAWTIVTTSHGQGGLGHVTLILSNSVTVVAEGNAGIVLVVLLQFLHSEAVVCPPKPLYTDGMQERTGIRKGFVLQTLSFKLQCYQ